MTVALVDDCDCVGLRFADDTFAQDDRFEVGDIPTAEEEAVGWRELQFTTSAAV
jgi:hypothetical protein